MNPLREALMSVPDETWLDRLARSSLRAAESNLYGSRTAPLLTVTLASGAADAYETASVLRGVQDATAKVGHFIRERQTERTSAQKLDREKARLMPRGQSGGTIFLGFPDPVDEYSDFILPDGHFPTLAEAAVHELIEYLPADPEDDRALDAVLSQRATIRSAIQDIVEVVHNSSVGMTMRLSTPGNLDAVSILTSAQARILNENLRETSTERTTLTATGILDGMRTSRRVFYLETDTGRDIHGAVDTDQLSAMRDLIGLRVTMKLEASTIYAKSGRKSQTTYRMIGVGADPSLFDEADNE